ncbi:hypothetical protein FACS189426_11090 [Bacteroidia bacterium]|nr:hypothetical protein FACS189426_11090 [Bacteroidia bacterium]
MNIIKKTIISLVYLLIFFACTNNEQKDNKENPILLKVGKEPEKEQVFKKYFELETVLPIETTNDFVITDIKKVLLCKDKLIILDRMSAICVVDYATGKIETYFKHIGQGPDESKNIIDITVDEKTETIFAYNDFHKLLFYDFRGNLLNQETFEKLYGSIIYDDGNVLFYNHAEGYSGYPYQIEKYNLQNKTLEKIGKDNRLDFPVRLYGSHFVKSKNIWFGTPFDFDLYLYDNSKIERKYKLDPETTPLTKEIMGFATSDPNKFYTARKENNIMYGICSIRETENYLVFISSGRGFFIFNKKNNEIHWENYVKETDLNLMLFNYFPHDGNDNRIMFIVTANEWRNGMGKMTMDNISETLKEKINSFTIEEDSNQILLFYREKN